MAEFLRFAALAVFLLLVAWTMLGAAAAALLIVALAWLHRDQYDADDPFPADGELVDASELIPDATWVRAHVPAPEPWAYPTRYRTASARFEGETVPVVAATRARRPLWLNPHCVAGERSPRTDQRDRAEELARMRTAVPTDLERTRRLHPVRGGDTR